jgi:hypothetical protein
MTDAHASPPRLRRQFERLAAQLAKTDWLLLGTIHERRIEARSSPGKRPRTYGPYHQWTFRRKGRTITVNLSASQVGAYRKAIHNQRATEKLLEQMRRLSGRFLEATTIGVPKRKPRK